MHEGPHPQDLVLSVETPVVLSASCTTMSSSGLGLCPQAQSWRRSCLDSPCHPPGNTSLFHVLKRKRGPKSRQTGPGFRPPGASAGAGGVAAGGGIYLLRGGGCGQLGDDLAHCLLTLCRGPSVHRGPGSPEPICPYSGGRGCRSPARSLRGPSEERPKLLRTQYSTRAHHLLE